MFTALDCHMKQYGSTKEESLSKFVELVEETWKDVNKEFVATTYVPKEIASTMLGCVMLLTTK